ncbi:putative bifunctional diguanylate cyclase/phosphodiesterase [Magnetovibrio sp.]|uniref:putative bifunctional diguanylate cyclase/phosphodiesterase n=1 Tax=Magnetovibrio sp. TaxID=2024836 RepID=UPI002F95B408
MTLTATIILISIFFQMSAAVLSLFLIRTTGWRIAWACIAFALLLMCIRRSITFINVVQDSQFTGNLYAELVALIISLLMLVGVALIGPLFAAAKRADKKVRDSERLFASIFHATPMATIVTRLSDEIRLDVNAEWETMFGYSRDQVVGKTPLDVQIWDTLDDRLRYTEMIKEAGRIRDFEARLRTASGQVLDALLSGEIVNLNGDPAILTVVHDITLRKQNEAKIAFQSNYDALTELPNRSLFADRLTQAISIARREKTLVALLYIDLDNFKVINDTLGHSAGDRLLIKATHRLLNAVREEDTVARLGGDEFTLILTGITKEAYASIAANKILNTLSQPFSLDGREIHISASIGISTFPRDGDDVEELLKNADTALYRAKAQGRGVFRFFTPEIQAAVTERVELEHGLRQALANDELMLYYQPLFDPKIERVIGAEALIRWNHPQRGMVSPDAFIPIAEDSGLIIPIGEWVIKTACTQLLAWQNAGFTGLRMSINLSIRQLGDPNLVACIERMLQDNALDPEQLELEITESLFVDHRPETLSVLKKLKALGVTLAIDDFGTGYSSLSYLKRFPIDTLKIDQSFIRDVTENTDSAAIVDAVVAMAHRLNLSVVGEGVETQEQLTFLNIAGCDIVQGYLLGRPGEADAMIPMLTQQRNASLDLTRPYTSS